MPAAHEEKLKQAFVRAINKAINDKEAFLKKIVENVEKVLPTVEEELSIEEIEAKLDDTIRKNRAEQIAEIIKEQDLVKEFDEQLY